MQTILIVLFVLRCAFSLTGLGLYAAKGDMGKVGQQIVVLIINAAMLWGIIYHY